MLNLLNICKINFGLFIHRLLIAAILMLYQTNKGLGRQDKPESL